MKKYCVLINGRNFLLDFDGKKQKMGFYTNRFVEAKSVKEAENLAIDLMRREPKLNNNVFNNQNDPPMLYVDEIKEVNQLRNQHGLGFYSEQEQYSQPNEK